MPVPKVKLWATWKLADKPLAKSAFPPSKTKLLKETSTTGIVDKIIASFIKLILIYCEHHGVNSHMTRQKVN